MVAAVQNGADAVYMGFGGLNARRSARNFTDEEFRAAVAYCHLRGVKVYLTLNTLVTDRELPAAAQALQKASDMGVDAILIQDWGVWRLAREIAPDVPLHASTQMSLFTSGGACEAARLGCERVVIARECSARDTEAICRSCPGPWKLQRKPAAWVWTRYWFRTGGFSTCCGNLCRTCPFTPAPR